MADRAPDRRTQESRSRAMRERLLQATLQSLVEVGYAQMSLGEIVRRAGVSRGAIDHHFHSKMDLAAAAMGRFMEERYERLYRTLVVDMPASAGIDQRLAVFRDEMMGLFPVTLEIIIATRTNPELAARMSALYAHREAEMIAGYGAMFPQIGEIDRRPAFVSLIVAFMRGLSIEAFSGNQAQIEMMYEMFRRMVNLYVDDLAREAAAAQTGR